MQRNTDILDLPEFFRKSIFGEFFENESIKTGGILLPKHFISDFCLRFDNPREPSQKCRSALSETFDIGGQMQWNFAVM